MAKKKKQDSSHLEQYQFKKGESGNPNGRPKKLINEILDDLKDQGAELVSKEQIKAIYTTLISMTQDQLTTLANDKSKQMIYRIISKAILSKKGFDIIETMLDRAHGKAIQTQEINQKTEFMTDGVNIILPEPSDEIKKKFDESQFNDD